MPTNPTDPRREYSSTYFADRSSQEEIVRLAVQDQIITQGMGGVLTEQSDPAKFQRVLDVACGTGGWLIEVAKTYPTITQLVGIDVNRRVIERAQVEAEQVRDRVDFRVMDALLILEFPQSYFDLVNMRLATSFLRTWAWPKMLNEFRRITRPGGLIRLTEIERIDANRPAMIRLFQLAGDAFYRAGHLFSEGQTEDLFSLCTIGIAGDLAHLLQQHGVQNVQTRTAIQEFRANTAAGQSFAEDCQLGFRTIVPFLYKWSHIPDNYRTIYQEMMNDMQQPDFEASWSLRTAWGNNPTTLYTSM